MAPGEGDVEALEIERDALEDVDEEELESKRKSVRHIFGYVFSL